MAGAVPFFLKILSTTMAAITVGDLKKWVGNDYQRVIALEVAMNPRGVYDFLKTNKLLGANWAKGFESTQTNRLEMARLLNEAAKNSGNPLQYAIMMAATTEDADLSRDHTAQMAVAKLLRDNP